MTLFQIWKKCTTPKRRCCPVSLWKWGPSRERERKGNWKTKKSIVSPPNLDALAAAQSLGPALGRALPGAGSMWQLCSHTASCCFTVSLIPSYPGQTGGVVRSTGWKDLEEKQIGTWLNRAKIHKCTILMTQNWMLSCVETQTKTRRTRQTVNCSWLQMTLLGASCAFRFPIRDMLTFKK